MIKSAYQTSVDLLIPFHDVDMMEVVWHGHYAKYFEIARCALLDTIGYNYPQMRDSGFAWPIIDLRIRYVKPATFGQLITVTAGIAEWENRLKIDYLISGKQSGIRLAKGYTIQVAVDMKTQTMLFESPGVLLAKLGITINQ
jgi:acyl-CoA thioester hydrolase